MAYDGGYAGSDADKALAWVSDATGSPVSGDLTEALKSGVALCELANAIQPGSVKCISKSAMPFPQRENINAFVGAARKFGVPDRDNFDTSDLFEGKNERQVLICLSALGRAVYSVAGYSGPALGRDAGSGGQGKHHAVSGGGGLWGKSGGQYGSKGGGVQIEATSRGTRPSQRGSPSPRGGASPAGKAAPPKPSMPPPKKAASPPKKALAPSPAPAPSAAGGGAAYDGGYAGSDADKALAWVSDATGSPVSGDLTEALKSGVALCELANAIQPGSVKCISKSAMPFPQRENINAFVGAARKFGVPDRDNFDTSDLFEGKNERQVLICLSALGRAVYSVAGYSGPALGRDAGSGGQGKHHAVSGGGGLWGKSGGQYGSKGGGVQIEATSRGVQPTQALTLAEEGIPPMDPSAMIGLLKKKQGVTSTWSDVNCAINGDDLLIDSTGQGKASSTQIALGDMFDCQMFDASWSEFELVGPSSTMRLRAESAAEAEAWIHALSARLAVAPSPLARAEPTVQARGKQETVEMWGVEVELVDASQATKPVIETTSFALTSESTKADFLTAVSDAIGADDMVDVSAGRQNFYMAKFSSAPASAQLHEFMTDGAVVQSSRIMKPAAKPKVAAAPSGPARTTKPSGTFVALQKGTRSQFTHYKAAGEEVTEGLDAALARKMAAKYDLGLQAEVCDWVAGLGVAVDGSSMDTFMTSLKDGVLLCQLVNKIRPGMVKKVNKMKMPFMQMENIASFLTAATAIGVGSSESFQTVDLFEAKNPVAVLLCLSSLMRCATE